MLQGNDINIDDETLQKYVRQYENGLGVDFMRLWQRIETVHGSSGIATDNQSINQSILYFSVEQSVTEYMWEYKSTHKIYKKKIERLAYSVQEFNTYY